MAVPAEAIEFTFQFSLSREGTDEDVAEFSIWCYQDNYEPDDTALLKLAHGAFNAWNDNVPGAAWCNNVFLSYVKARKFLPNGHTLAEQIYQDPDGWVGTAPPPALPWETSLALSLYTYERGTFVVNGKRKRGRIYLPPMAANQLETSNSGYFLNGGLPTLLGQLGDFVGRVGQEDLGVKVTRPVIFSRVDGVCRPITQLSIDAKFDSQRRRSNREKAGVIAQNYHE